MYAPYTPMLSMHAEGELYRLYSTFKILHLGDFSNRNKFNGISHLTNTCFSLRHLQLVVPTNYGILVKRTRSSSLGSLCLIPVKSPNVSGYNYFHLYLLTPWCRVLLEKLTGLQLVKKIPAFHGTRRFITALTSVRQLSLSWASPIQSIYPHPTSWISILILSTHLHLGLPSGLLPSGLPSKTLYTTLSSPIRATCPAHLILLDFITRTILGEE